jgi:hypothetical protein
LPSNARHNSFPVSEPAEIFDSPVTTPLGDVSEVIVGMARNTAAVGVTLLLADVYVPTAVPLTAATRNTYAVPLVKLVTVADVAVDVPSANVVHVVPESLLYCTL